MKFFLLAAWLAVHLSACSTAASATPPPAPPITAQPVTIKSTLDVASSAFTVDEFGDFHCTGELVNATNTSVDVLSLTATVTTRLGTTISTETAWAAASHLEPNERAPFRVSPLGIRNAVASDYQCAITVEIKASAPIAKTITIKDARYSIDKDGFIHLTGTAVNISSAMIKVTLIGGLKDSSGRVVDADFLNVTLPPNVETPFDFASLSATNYNKALQKTVAGVVVK